VVSDEYFQTVPVRVLFSQEHPHIEKKVLRIIGKVGQHASCRNLFKDLDILPLSCLYRREVVCCVKSNMEKMKYNKEVCNHCTSQKSDLHTQFCRTTFFKNTTANVGKKLHNKLPNTVTRLDKIQEFKRRLKYFFSATYFLLNG
jgi:hypothetical protein